MLEHRQELVQLLVEIDLQVVHFLCLVITALKKIVGLVNEGGGEAQLGSAIKLESSLEIPLCFSGLRGGDAELIFKDGSRFFPVVFPEVGELINELGVIKAFLEVAEFKFLVFANIVEGPAGNRHAAFLIGFFRQAPLRKVDT